MTNLTPFNNSSNAQLIDRNRCIIATNNFVFTEQLSVNILRYPVKLIAPKFPIPTLSKICMYTLNNSFNRSIHTQNWAHLPPEWKQISFSLHSSQQQAITITSKRAIDFFYLQRWEREICNRFKEARKRYPEFFPCFELKESLQGLQYAIYFKPLTQYAKTLVGNALLFPHQQQFKPIEQLWQENGQSELDIIFERFPTQLALKVPKKSWKVQCKQLFLGLLDRGLELTRIDSLFVQKNAEI